MLETVPRLWGRVEGTGRDTDFPALYCPLNQSPSSKEASGHNLGAHLTASCSPQDSVLKIPWSDLGSFLLRNVISLWRVPHIYRCRCLSVESQGGAICHIRGFQVHPSVPYPLSLYSIICDDPGECFSSIMGRHDQVSGQRAHSSGSARNTGV